MKRHQQYCVFCGGSDLSKEHFWPEWASDLLPESGAHKIMRAVGDGPMQTHRDRQGGAKTIKLRVVCRSCNHGWMRDLEDAARPILTPLIVGNPIVLGVEDQKVLAEWIALKVILLEQSNKPEVVITQAERTAFCENRTIPANMRIRLAICGEGSWRSATVRTSTWVSPLSKFTSVKPGMNVQVSTVGVGDLLIHSSICNSPGFDIDEVVPVNERIYRLWPLSGDELNWPYRQGYMSSASAARLCERIALLQQLPNSVRI